LEVISRLTPEARDALSPGGWLALEVSGTIADEVRRLLSGWKGVQVTKDLQGITRVIAARTA
jgi:release factor glutamine methyltransferase